MNLIYIVGMIVIWLLVAILTGIMFIAFIKVYYSLYVYIKGFKSSNKVLIRAICIAKDEIKKEKVKK